MKSAIIALTALVAGSFVSQAYDSQRYDSTFAAELSGVYGWAGKSHQPNIGGGLLSLSNYIDTDMVYHQISLTAGSLTGSRTIHFNDESLKSKLTTVPLMFGYTMNLPVSDSVIFYVGGKIGVSFDDADVYQTNGERINHSGCDFAWSVNSGFKISLSEKTDLKIGYEYFTFDPKKSLPYHTVQIGVSFNF